MTEVRVVNPVTGGAKGSKIERYDLIPWDQMGQLAKLYGKGAEKYDERNWELGIGWNLCMASMMRHLTAFWNGESYDSETECHHLASVMFYCLAFMRFEKTHPELDTRPKL